MVISKVFIKAYKSIQSLTLPIDPQITVLIGANESGKTNVLKAIESFLPDQSLSLDQTCQYAKEYQDGKPPQIGLEITSISKDERAQLTKMYDGFRNLDAFTLMREGPEYSDYKIQTSDKMLTIGNAKPLFTLLPKIVYFDTIPIIRDMVDLETLTNGTREYRTEINLLKIGGVDDPSIVFEDSMRGRRAVEETSREITQRIREVWQQEPSLEIKLRVNGNLPYIDFSDATTVYDTPKSRSLGFLWYLSFYINFIATTLEARTNEYLFLLDEPGQHLHPAGQKDLNRLLENLSEKNQVVYTTHSPFMINREYPQRVRVVNKTEQGTQVDVEAYRENWKPLRQSIGLTVSDLFFFSNKGMDPDMGKKVGPFKK